jgi:hypothetical protein
VLDEVIRVGSAVRQFVGVAHADQVRCDAATWVSCCQMLLAKPSIARKNPGLGPGSHIPFEIRFRKKSPLDVVDIDVVIEVPRRRRCSFRPARTLRNGGYSGRFRVQSRDRIGDP